MLILALCFPREAKGSSDKKGKELFNVLVIQSYNQSLSAYSKFDKLLHEELEKEQIYSSIHTFYLDCERYNATDEEARMYSFLDTLSFKPDIIISNDDQATYTLMACNHPLGKTVPVVFSGVNFPNWKIKNTDLQNERIHRQKSVRNVDGQYPGTWNSCLRRIVSNKAPNDFHGNPARQRRRFCLIYDLDSQPDRPPASLGI